MQNGREADLGTEMLGISGNGLECLGRGQLLPPAPQQQVASATQESAMPAPEPEACGTEDEWQPTCPECGGAMGIAETLPKAAPIRSPRIDTS
jgi:hypothetical protein